MSPLSLVPDIILIGPIRSGKTTQGRLLAEKLEVPQICMDELCWDYYKEIGYYNPETDVSGPDGMIASRYTEGKTPEETRDEILTLVEPKPRKMSRHTRTRRKSEMIAKLAAALDAAEESSLRSILLITAQTDGGGECWARISDEDQTTTCDYLAALKQDMKCP